MNSFRFVLLTDGPSDQVLIHPIRWILDDCRTCAYSWDWADPTTFSERGLLRTRIREAVLNYPCDLLIVHRDTEREPLATRKAEIDRAIEDVSPCPPVVCLVPVRMTEAWLLSDEAAIRNAAGNPAGRIALDLPRPRELESIPDPKERLDQALLRATELSGRRLERSRRRLSPMKHRVGELTPSFEALRQLPAFSSFEVSLREALQSRGWVLGT